MTEVRRRDEMLDRQEMCYRERREVRERGEREVLQR
jgi:hypothetical protein